MISRVFFMLDVDGQYFPELYVDIKQTVGSSYETGAIEVGGPQGAKYRGPWNYQAFRSAAAAYYRRRVGAQGSGIKFGGGASNIRMRNNTFIVSESVEFELLGPEAAW